MPSLQYENFINEMAQTRTKIIGTGSTVTIIGLILWFIISGNFNVEIDLSDKICAGTYKEPCEASFNITSKTFTYYLYNKEGIDLSFIPEVKESYICKKDGRYTSKERANRELYPCGIGYREFDFKTPLTSKYSYVEKFEKGIKKEYKLVVFKFNPIDDIKWGGEIIGADKFDPIFFGDWNITKLCIWRNEIQDIYGNKTYEYTCLTNTFNFNTTIKKAYCKNDSINSTGGHSVIFQHNYDYGYLANKTIYWSEWEKIGEEIIQICDKWTGVLINGKTLDWEKYGFQCSRPETKVFECDRCDDDGNCDGIWHSGESGCRFELANGTINKNCKGDTPNIREIIKRFKVE